MLSMSVYVPCSLLGKTFGNQHEFLVVVKISGMGLHEENYRKKCILQGKTATDIYKLLNIRDAGA